jgi:hypothetical protein
LGARKKKNMPYQLPRTTTKAEFSKPGESLNSFVAIIVARTMPMLLGISCESPGYR